jgi:hypothetical protein
MTAALLTLAAPAHAALTFEFSGTDGNGDGVPDFNSSFVLQDNGAVDTDGDGADEIVDGDGAPNTLEVAPGPDAPDVDGDGASEVEIGGYVVDDEDSSSIGFDFDANPQTADLFETQGVLQGNPGDAAIFRTQEDDYSVSGAGAPRIGRWNTTVTPSQAVDDFDFTVGVEGSNVASFNNITAPSLPLTDSGTISLTNPVSISHTSLLQGGGTNSFDATTAVASPATVGLLGMGLVVVGVAVSRSRQS